MKRPGRSGLRSAFLVSAVVHAAAVGLIWVVASSIESIPPMRVYAVDLVSPPPQQLGEPRPAPPSTPEPEPESEPEVQEPEPTPPPPPPPPAPAPVQRPTPPAPAPPPPRQQPTPPAQQRAQQQAPSTGARPDPSSPGGENIDLRLPGAQCPTPDYCNNIVRQIYRYFRSPGGAGEAEVFFQINRDGSIAGLRVVTSTGGAAFRLAALEAVEQAGINRSFGPLPPVYSADQLPVSFYFRPAR